jgi:pheromone shutdown protein TraB
MKLLSVLISSAFTNEKITEEELEELKKSSAIENMMGELADFLPPVKEVLIDERDQYLAANIFNARGTKVVAVIGAGHAPGLIGWLEKLMPMK